MRAAVTAAAVRWAITTALLSAAALLALWDAAEALLGDGRDR